MNVHLGPYSFQEIVITPASSFQLWVVVLQVLEDAPLGNGLVTGVAPHLHLVARLRAQEIIFCIRHLHKASASVFVLMVAQ